MAEADLNKLQMELAEHLGAAVETCQRFNLNIDRATLVLRDRNNDDHSIVLTDENPAEADDLVRVIRARLADRARRIG